MKQFSYTRYIWRANKGIALFGMIFISLFQFMILFLVKSFDTASIATAILNQLPENLRIFLNDGFFNMLTFNGAAAFGFNHPMVLVLMAFISINLPVRHISREIENGSMEVMLSFPVRREKIILKLWGSSLLILFTIIFISILGTLFAIHTFHELSNEALTRTLMIGTNLWLLFTLVMSYTLLFSTFGKRGNFAANMAAMLTLVFYLVFFLSKLWDVIEFTKLLNIFNYFEPQKIMTGQAHFFADCLVLGVASITCLLVSVWQFKRRDIP